MRTDDDCTEGPLRELLDKDAIRDLVSTYAHNVWRRDVKAIVDLFADDAVMDTLTRPTIRGRAELLEAFEEMLAEDELHPFLHNHVIEVDGDTAVGTCYLDLRAKIDGRRLTGWGWYDDRYVRVDGRWRFSYRRVNMVKLVPVGRSQESSVEGRE